MPDKNLHWLSQQKEGIEPYFSKHGELRTLIYEQKGRGDVEISVSRGESSGYPTALRYARGPEVRGRNRRTISTVGMPGRRSKAQAVCSPHTNGFPIVAPSSRRRKGSSSTSGMLGPWIGNAGEEVDAERRLPILESPRAVCAIYT